MAKQGQGGLEDITGALARAGVKGHQGCSIHHQHTAISQVMPRRDPQALT